MNLKILCAEMWALSAAMIQDDIDSLKTLQDTTICDDEENEVCPGEYENVSIGAPQPKTTFGKIEASWNELGKLCNTPNAFENFTTHFATFLASLSLPSKNEIANDLSLPIQPDDYVSFKHFD